mgnify:FL=1
MLQSRKYKISQNFLHLLHSSSRTHLNHLCPVNVRREEHRHTLMCQHQENRVEEPDPMDGRQIVSRLLNRRQCHRILEQRKRQDPFIPVFGALGEVVIDRP